MIVSSAHRYVFVEVPHTGSTAIAAELCQHHGGRPLLAKHSAYSEFWHIATPEERRYRAIVGVRNPLDSTVTDYLRYRANPRGHFTNPRLRAESGGWVREAHLERFRFVQAGHDFTDYFWRFIAASRPYYNFSLASPRPFDFVIRHETLPESFAECLRSLGLAPTRPLPRKNATPAKRADFASYYAPEIQPFAARVFGPFMAQWGYSLPEDWSVDAAPLSSRVAFAALDASVRVASSAFRVGPFNPSLLDARVRLARSTSWARQLTAGNADVGGPQLLARHAA